MADGSNASQYAVGWTMPSESFKRFMDSTKIDYEQWHDGEPYDLEALDDLTQAETNDVIRWVLDRSPADWRDLQVLSHIGSSVTLFKLEKFLESDVRDLRLTAIDLLLEHDRVPDAEDRIVREIETTGDDDSAVRLFFLLPRFNTPAVQQALLAAMKRGTNFSIQAAAKLMELRGVIDSEWDWTHRPLWLRLKHGETDADKKEAFEAIRTLVKM